MKSMLIDGWIHARGSYWFVPSLMATSAIGLALMLVLIELRTGIDWPGRFPHWFSARADSVQALLAAIAGSMITVAGVTFSLTLLAVSHATSQIGHSLLGKFMEDRGNQIALGTFIATFLYCVVVLRSFGLDSVDADSIGDNIPHLATLVAVILSVCSVMVLIYFIHHVTQSINVSNVITRLGDALLECVEQTYPEPRSDHKSGDCMSGEATRRSLPNTFFDNAVTVVRTGKAGYVRVVDTDSLVAIAADSDLVVELRCRPGDFVIPGEELMRVQGADEITDELRTRLCSVFSTGSDRTPEQDVLLVAEQLIEIVGKALSPGINNQRTAILCFDQLGRSLVQIMNRDEPDEGLTDESGKLRVRCRAVSRAEFYGIVTDSLLQYVRGDWIATRHFVRMLRRLASLTSSDAWAKRVSATLDIVRGEAKCSDMPDSQFANMP